ncbi:MAG: molybdopterin converting factor subunit 1 [Gammaproteobacteria bacterium]|nr:molybdopterin converting factor subunit 1 [Gammaproteobacteria bacterium]
MLKVVFFARLREAVNMDEISFDLGNEPIKTVADVIQLLTVRHKDFNDYIQHNNRLMIAVNQEIVDENKEVNSGDELAFFPPVTGG